MFKGILSYFTYFKTIAAGVSHSSVGTGLAANWKKGVSILFQRLKKGENIYYGYEGAAIGMIKGGKCNEMAAFVPRIPSDLKKFWQMARKRFRVSNYQTFPVANPEHPTAWEKHPELPYRGDILESHFRRQISSLRHWWVSVLSEVFWVNHIPPTDMITVTEQERSKM